MRIFTTKDGYWDEKVNFVDEHGVFVGYDMMQCCCENADWFIADEIATVLPDHLNQPGENDLSDYRFDKAFFKEVNSLKYDDDDYPEWNALDQGGCAVFRITDGKNEKYLHIFNSHNGYYGHGFEVKHGGEIVHQGTL